MVEMLLSELEMVSDEFLFSLGVERLSSSIPGATKLSRCTYTLLADIAPLTATLVITTLNKVCQDFFTIFRVS